MKNMEAILKEAGIELTDDQRKAVTAGVAENYKPVSDWQKQVDKTKAAEITGEDGLKWKDGAFLGFDDYVKAENEKDHFYDTDEEKAAEGRAPKFTDRSDQSKGPSKVPEVPRIW